MLRLFFETLIRRVKRFFLDKSIFSKIINTEFLGTYIKILFLFYQFLIYLNQPSNLILKSKLNKNLITLMSLIAI